MDITKKELLTGVAYIFVGIAAFIFAMYLLFGFLDWVMGDPLNLIRNI